MNRQDFFPDRYEVARCKDPIIDKVAIQRALDGDPSVLDAMTAREREALLEALADLRHDPDIWYRNWVPGKDGQAGTWVHEPVYTLAALWGMDREYLWKRVEYRINRDRKAKWQANKNAEKERAAEAG